MRWVGMSDSSPMLTCTPIVLNHAHGHPVIFVGRPHQYQDPAQNMNGKDVNGDFYEMLTMGLGCQHWVLSKQTLLSTTWL